MYIFSSRIYNDDVLDLDHDPESLLRDMMTALTELVRVDKVVPTDRTSSEVGSKNTLPMDLGCFEYFARSVDYLTLMARKEGGEENIKVAAMV
jgi:hypothetical protein